ncbi:M23 family metallopeptidase [Kordiimonas gwangyangensis]|uniref:M23 family metallopeptidase n=1 Tax=Kordiimonas gwangyangensis TaxID=288022 RepID=UPI002351ECF6|nr:peptidoglycan DD-metalloendopeptidase family protein [Kordiimonas gwangyangensis]
MCRTIRLGQQLSNGLTWLDKFHAFRGKYFPERQLFLRSEGRVRFLTIGSYTQMGMASALAIAAIWGAVTSYAYLTQDETIAHKNRTISTMSAQYQELSKDFSALELEVERRAQQLEMRQKFLEEFLNSEPADAPDEAAQPVEASEEAAAGSDSVKKTSHNIDPDAGKATFVERLFGAGEAQAAVHSNIDRRISLLNRLQEMERRQREFAAKLKAEAETKLASIETILGPTKLGTEDLLAKLDESGVAQGGPYVPDATFEGVFADEDGAVFGDLISSHIRLEMVTNALNSFPVGKPAENYYLSSRFGRRVDPLKKTWANHPGLDLAGWPGTAIYATAPGKVVHAGWYGPYGNMVEIDHGNGFRTRYGHMRKVRVKKNDEVTLGQRVGDMGKTGRVTGTHLHYEVWFDGSVRDPMPYLKAANDVLEIQGRHEETSTHE